MLVAPTWIDVTGDIDSAPGSAPDAATAPPPLGTTCWNVPPSDTVTPQVTALFGI